MKTFQICTKSEQCRFYHLVFWSSCLFIKKKKKKKKTPTHKNTKTDIPGYFSINQDKLVKAERRTPGQTSSNRDVC